MSSPKSGPPTGLDLHLLEVVRNSPHAAISKIEAFRYGHGIKERMTFRELLGKISKNQDQDKWYTYGHIPYSVKEMIRYPAPLRCPKIAFQTMVETRQLFYNIEVSKPIRQELNHQLYCMVEGEKEIVLIDEADFPSWSNMKLVDDGYSGKLNPFVDVSKIDYNTHPGLKDIKKIHIAKLQAGDCLFVPARWIHQQNVLDKDNSLEIRWQPLENESDLDCSGYLSPILTLGDLPWLGEKIVKPPERSTDPKRHAFKRLLHLLQRVVLTNQAIGITDFSSIIKMDPFLAPELPKWDDDCQEISETLFHLLDRNKDGKLTANDLDNILELDVDHWANLIHDQLSLLAEVIFDMRVDLAGAIPLDETVRQRVIQMIDIKEK
ncbi:hypothetical protein TCAL_16487 [Tigriopus californicus]|uniref:EF-hand domain-containing protein n=1 Tax=Tigriopus californicus TaxID=6832 RepID=A0A553NTN8_TIGCA|nr:hypothetical protein TCAL_16487 [Tigriopus californicus]